MTAGLKLISTVRGVFADMQTQAYNTTCSRERGQAQLLSLLTSGQRSPENGDTHTPNTVGN